MEEQLKLQSHLRSLLTGLLFYYPSLKIEGVTPEKHPDFNKESLVRHALKITQTEGVEEAVKIISSWLAQNIELTSLPPEQLQELEKSAEERKQQAEKARERAREKVQKVVTQPRLTPPETPPAPEPEEVVYYEPVKTYVPPPLPPEAREKVAQIRERIETRGEAYTQDLTTEFSPRVAIESLPPGITAEVMTKKAVTGALDLITNFNPIQGAAEVLLGPSNEKLRLTKHIVAAITTQEVADYLLPSKEVAQKAGFKKVAVPQGDTYAVSQAEGIKYIPPIPKTLGGLVLEAAAYETEKASQKEPSPTKKVNLREESLVAFLYSQRIDATNLALLGLSSEQERELRRILEEHVSYAGFIAKPTLLEAEIRRAGLPQQVSGFLKGEAGLPRQGLFKRVFQQLFGKASTALVKTALKKGAQKLGQKLLEKGALAALGTAVAPGVGTAIGLAVDFIKDKILIPLARLLRDPERRREFATFLAALGLGSIAAGVMLGVTPLVVLAVPLLAASFAALGPAQAIQLGATRIGTGLIGFTTFALEAIALPLVITLISIPIAIALILFIINSGAYVIPPGGEFLTGTRFGPGGVYPMCWPMYGYITNLPYYYPKGSSELHRSGKMDAFDIATGEATEVYATHDGRAIPQNRGDGYGNFVDVVSDKGFKTRYAHLATMIATEMNVKAGTLIGTEGSTGNSTGPHLHYELRDASFRLTDAVPQIPRFDDCRNLHCKGTECYCNDVLIYTNGCLAKDQGGGENPPLSEGGQPPAGGGGTKKCGETCYEETQCSGTLKCINGLCRNEACPADSDCVCEIKRCLVSTGGICYPSAGCPEGCEIPNQNDNCSTGEICCKMSCGTVSCYDDLKGVCVAREDCKPGCRKAGLTRDCGGTDLCCDKTSSACK